MSDTPRIHDEVTRTVINDENLYTAARGYKRRYGIKEGAYAFHSAVGERLSKMIGHKVSKTAIVTVMRNV